MSGQVPTNAPALDMSRCFFLSVNERKNTADVGLQIYGGPGSLSHDFKIWPFTFQGSGPVDPSLLVVKKSHFNKKYSSYRESTNST